MILQVLARVAVWSGGGVLLLWVCVQLWTGWCRYRSNYMPGPNFWWLFAHFNDFHTASAKLNEVYGGIYNMFMGNRTMTVVSDPALLQQLLSDTHTFPKVTFKEVVTSKRLTDFLGVGFLGLNGKDWWAVKKHFAGAFHFRALKPLVPVFHRRAQHLLRCMVDSASTGTDVEAKQWMSRLSLDILGHTMFGVDLGALPPCESEPGSDTPSLQHNLPVPDKEHRCHLSRLPGASSSPMMQAYDCFFDSIGDVRTAMLPNYDAWPFVSRHKRCLPSSLQLLNTLILNMIDRHNRELDELDERGDAAACADPVIGKTGHEESTTTSISPPPSTSSASHQASEEERQQHAFTEAAADAVIRNQARLTQYGATNLLHSMLHSVRQAANQGKPLPLSHEDLRANLLTFFIAGHDTTSSALSWALFYLASNPQVQAMLRCEVLQHSPWSEVSLQGEETAEAKPPREPTYDDVKPGALPYMDAFLNEVMRCRPPLSNFLTRKASKTVNFGGYVIRKGQFVSPSIFNVHHDPKIWHDPYKFDPSRFLGNASKKRHPYAFIPFLMGKRKCIGSTFSLLEQRVFLAELVSRFEVRPAPDLTPTPTPHVAFYSPRQVRIRLVPREPVKCSQVDDCSSVSVASSTVGVTALLQSVKDARRRA